MKCETVRDRLLDHMDGDLESRLAEEVESHLGRCLECRKEFMAYRDLREQAAEWRSAEEPRVDLWPDIERRLTETSPVHRSRFYEAWSFRVLAAAAMLTLVVGSSLWLLGPPNGEPLSIETAERVEPIDLRARADQARVESGVIQLRRDLLGELDRRREELEPETWRAIESSLHELDEAIGEIRLALDASPQDPRLNHLLARRYRQELNFLRKITRA